MLFNPDKMETVFAKVLVLEFVSLTAIIILLKVV